MTPTKQKLGRAVTDAREMYRLMLDGAILRIATEANITAWFSTSTNSFRMGDPEDFSTKFNPDNPWHLPPDYEEPLRSGEEVECSDDEINWSCGVYICKNPDGTYRYYDYDDGAIYNVTHVVRRSPSPPKPAKADYIAAIEQLADDCTVEDMIEKIKEVGK